jgi:nucleoside-diphosphate-sugar epimerase
MKTLVTGAGGFVGGRIVEILEAERPGSTVAGIRRWSTAARIGRLPVDIVQCDVMDPGQVAECVSGVSHVIHCATGPGDVNVQGTRNVLQASLDAGVQRIVHISTIALYGNQDGELTEEDSPEFSGVAYPDSKLRTEQVCQEFIERGLALSIVRPTIVYGPFSALWTEEFAVRLQNRPWPFPRELSSGTCNLVYIDDLVAGIRLALTRPEAIGEVFNLNGPETPTWFEYFVALNRAMGLPPIEAKSTLGSQIAAWGMKPVRASAKFALARFGDQIMSVYKSSELAKKVMKGAEGAIRKAPTTGEFELYSKVLSFPNTKAERLLGYRPAVDMEAGIERSVAWLAHSGFMNGGRPVRNA